MDPLFDAATDMDQPGITTIDTGRFLCTATTCPAVIGTVVVYFDASHMTATYARSIAPFIERRHPRCTRVEAFALVPGTSITRAALLRVHEHVTVAGTLMSIGPQPTTQPPRLPSRCGTPSEGLGSGPSFELTPVEA